MDASSAPPSCAASYQEYAYLPSSSSFANFDSFNGWKVSHINASSWVSCMPMVFSATPGCGPSGSKSSLRGQNEQITKFCPWNVWCDGGGWWMRPVIGSKSWTENVHG